MTKITGARITTPKNDSPMEAHNGWFDEDEDEDDDATTKALFMSCQSCHYFLGFLLPSRDDVLGIYQPWFSIFSH